MSIQMGHNGRTRFSFVFEQNRIQTACQIEIDINITYCRLFVTFSGNEGGVAGVAPLAPDPFPQPRSTNGLGPLGSNVRPLSREEMAPFPPI